MLLGIFLLVLLIVALLPTIASTAPVKSMVLERINRRLNGAVAIDSWSLGWFSGFKLRGIRLADAQGRTVVAIRSVIVPASVPALLGSHRQLGAVAIESPKADIVLYPDGTNSLTRLIKPAQAAAGGDPPDPATPPQPLGFDVTGVIGIMNGELSLQSAKAGRLFLVRELHAAVKIESLEKPIRLDLIAALGEERAALSVDGSATVLHAGRLDPNAVEAEIFVLLNRLDIGPLAALARQYGAPVEAGGLLSVRMLNAQVHGLGSIQAVGDIALDRLALSGGPLGKDGPKFDHVGLAFNISKASWGGEGPRALLAAVVADAMLRVTFIEFMGVETGALHAPVQVKDSIAAADITATVNGGALKLPVRIDMSRPTPELTLPPNTAILTDMKITPEMVGEALSKALPLFKGCTVAEGSVSLDSKSLDVPLGAEMLRKAAFEGELALKGVRMNSAGQLASILAPLGLAGGDTDLARIEDQRLSLSLRDGRMYQGRMLITIAGLAFTISGSVGLADKTLDMTVEVPITPAMVGGRKDLNEALKGQAIRIAITGTTDQPIYSVKEGVQELIQNAAKKLLEQRGGNLLNQGIENLLK
jgi:hypothetical protein